VISLERRIDKDFFELDLVTRQYKEFMVKGTGYRLLGSYPSPITLDMRPWTSNLNYELICKIYTMLVHLLPGVI
jgi:hypothetical protein